MRKQTLLGVFLLTFCAVADGTKPVPPTASAGAVDCVKNGSFEMRGAVGEKCWRLSEGWSIGRGFGRNGSGGLVFESAERREKPSFAEQTVDVEPGRIYDFEAWIDVQMDLAKGINVKVSYLDGNGKRVGGIYTGARPPPPLVARTRPRIDAAHPLAVPVKVMHVYVYALGQVDLRVNPRLEIVDPARLDVNGLLGER